MVGSNAFEDATQRPRFYRAMIWNDLLVLAHLLGRRHIGRLQTQYPIFLPFSDSPVSLL